MKGPKMKDGHFYPTSSMVVIGNDSFIASIIEHNARRFWYMCIFVAGMHSSSEAVIDDFGNLVAIPSR